MSKLYLGKSEKDCWKMKLQGYQWAYVWCKYWTEQGEQSSVSVIWMGLSFILIRTDSEKCQWGIEIGKKCIRKWSRRTNYSWKLGALKWEWLNHAGFESAQEERLENAKNSWKELQGKSKQGVENRSCCELSKHHEHLSEEGWLRGEKGQAQSEMGHVKFDMEGKRRFFLKKWHHSYLTWMADVYTSPELLHRTPQSFPKSALL